MEPTTVGSLWLENDLHENELEFESHMGRSKKNVRVTSDGIHAEIHEIWTCVAPAAPPLCHAAVNPCLQSCPIGVLMKRVHETGRATAQIYVKAQEHEWVDTMSLQ